MKTDVTTQLTGMLRELERHLRELSLWSDEVPSAHQLASIEPFCVDTLNFAQWLQFVFLPRMSGILDAKLTLPGKSQIAPMAEMYFRELALDASALCFVLQQIDSLLTPQS